MASEQASQQPFYGVSALLFATGAAATVTDTVRNLLGRPAISFEQFVKDHRAAFLP
jgi:hypothetical protein